MGTLWSPYPVCDPTGCCKIVYDNDGVFTEFRAKCPAHQKLSDAGMDDEALFREIQTHSMRWAHSVQVMEEKHPDSPPSFDSSDHSITVATPEARADIEARIKACPVLHRLTGGSGVEPKIKHRTKRKARKR